MTPTRHGSWCCLSIVPLLPSRALARNPPGFYLFFFLGGDVLRDLVWLLCQSTVCVHKGRRHNRSHSRKPHRLLLRPPDKHVEGGAQHLQKQPPCFFEAPPAAAGRECFSCVCCMKIFRETLFLQVREFCPAVPLCPVCTPDALTRIQTFLFFFWFPRDRTT